MPRLVPGGSRLFLLPGHRSCPLRPPSDSLLLHRALPLSLSLSLSLSPCPAWTFVRVSSGWSAEPRHYCRNLGLGFALSRCRVPIVPEWNHGASVTPPQKARRAWFVRFFTGSGGRRHAPLSTDKESVYAGQNLLGWPRLNRRILPPSI